MTRQNPGDYGRSSNSSGAFAARLDALKEKAASAPDRRGIDDLIHKLECSNERLEKLEDIQARLWSIDKSEVGLVLVLEAFTRSLWGLDAIVDAAEAHARGSEESDVIRHLVEAVSHAAGIQRLVVADQARDRVAFLGSKMEDLPRPPMTLRDLRNTLEHFEERLDRWALPTISRHLGRDTPKGMSAPMPVRSYSEDLKTFCVLDHCIDIWELADWLESIMHWASTKRPSA